MWGHHILCAPSTLGYWQAESKFSDTVVTPSTAQASCSRVTLNFDRTTPIGTREDFASFTLHMFVGSWNANAVSLTDSQKGDAETDLNAWVSSWTAKASSAYTFTNYTWHDVAFGDQFYGPADRITQTGNPGTNAADRLPDQITTNITFRTASRQHWGRFYCPGLGAAQYEKTFGRPANTTCDWL